jgi:hypothetical protein
MNWSASRQPSVIEDLIANEVRERWIDLNAADHKNPLTATPENLANGRRVYDEHCAVCHGLDGIGKNRLAADFYPPVARLIAIPSKCRTLKFISSSSKGLRCLRCRGSANITVPKRSGR